MQAQMQLLARQEDSAKSEKKAARSAFVEQQLVTTLTAGSKIANGIGGAVGALKYTNDAHNRFIVGGATNIAYGTSYAVASAEMIRNQFFSELKYHKQKKEHKTKTEVLAAEIESIESLQSSVSGGATGIAGGPQAQ